MFEQASRPSGSTQTTFNGTGKPSKLLAERVNQQYLSSLNRNSLLDVCSSYSSLGAFIAEHQHNLSYDNQFEYLNPALLITFANKEDNPTFKEAMISPEAAGFVSAMKTGILTLIELDIFDIVPQSQQKVIFGIWLSSENDIQMDPFKSSRLDTVLVDSNNKKELIILKLLLPLSCG